MRHHRWIVAFIGSMLVGTTVFGAEPWTLERSLEYALGHNPDAQLARQRLAAAQARLEQANAAFWPRLQLHQHRKSDAGVWEHPQPTGLQLQLASEFQRLAVRGQP